MLIPRPTHFVAVICVVSTTCAAAPPASQPAAEPCKQEICKTALRLARSEDGVEFRADGLFSPRAAAPDLIRLPNRYVLALFDTVSDSDTDQTVLAVARSKDDGNTWSPPRRIVLEQPNAAHASALLMPSGWLRIYYCIPPERQWREGCTIGSALTRDGVHYRIDPQVRIRVESAVDAHPCVAWIDGQVNLFVVVPSAGKDADKNRVVTQCYVSSDVSHFKLAERTVLESRLTQIISKEKQSNSPRHAGVRALSCRNNEVVSYLLDAGGRWRAETGVRLLDANDAAMVQRTDGTFLMLFATGMDPATATQPALASQPSTQPYGKEKLETADATETQQPQSDRALSESWEPFAPPLNTQTAAPGQAGDTDYPPTTDLSNPVDYVQWFKEHYNADQPDNVYNAYQEVLNAESSWIYDDVLKDIRDGPIEPWNPLQHPQWEAAYQAMNPVLQQFQRATQTPGHFSLPIQFASDAAESGPSLVTLLLPSLSDFRRLTRATLADAWRQQGGIVPPDQMRDALCAALNNSNHLNDERLTSIEHLVAIGQKNLAYEHARQALAHGVFNTPAEIENALQSLQQSDGQDSRRSHWLPFEQACALDTMQYLFPPSPDGQPHVNVERVRKMFYGEESRWTPDVQKRVSSLTADDARQAIETFNATYRQLIPLWKTGFPTARTDQIGAVEEQCANALPRMKPLDSVFPNWARAHQLEVRTESTRRATQLTYHLHLYHAKSGQWPTTLDQVLPSGDAVRTDPFTGGDYAYQLTPAGPKLYSLSNNGQDDGGVHSSRWADEDSKARAGGSDDYVFWPPQ